MKFLLVVHGDVTELFLDVLDDFLFGGGGETVFDGALSEELAEIFGEVSSGEVISLDGMG